MRWYYKDKQVNNERQNIVLDCGSVPSVSSGVVVLDSTDTTYKATATVTCNNGYEANQSSISCQASASWEVPTCSIKGNV